MSPRLHLFVSHVIIQRWGVQVSPRFHLFVSDVNQGKKEAR